MEEGKDKMSYLYLKENQPLTAKDIDTSWKAGVPWYESAVFYHIYPLGMCGCPRENSEDSEKRKSATNILEIEKIIPHLQAMGVNAMYIGPLFESAAHGYETYDYKLVDRRLGTNEDFIHLVDRLHDAGIKVVVDGVFNHSGRGFFAFKDLREKKGNSAYKDWYCRVDFGGNSAFNDGFSYEAWHGFQELPRLNVLNPAVKDYLKDVIRFWRNEFHIDGIRLDCADVLDFNFMKELRSLANEFGPEFWLMGEVIHGDYSRWANNDTLHSVTDYEMHKGIFSGHNDHNYFEIAHSARRLFDPNGGIARGVRLYNFIENHDVDRLVEKLKNREHWKNCYTLVYTLPGVPSVYYGGEFAIRGKKENNQDYALRPQLLASDYERLAKENHEEESFIEYLGKLRNGVAALTTGKYRQLALTNRQFSFARVCDNGDVAVILMNNDDNAAEMRFAMPCAGKYIDTATGNLIDCTDGGIAVRLAGNSSAVLVLDRN